MVVVQLGPYPPPHGGVQTNLVAIREHLRRHGGSAPVINLTRHRRADADEVYYPQTTWQVLKLLLRIRAEIIHLHIGGRLTTRLLGLCLICSWIPRRRVVLTFHSGGYPSMREGQRAHRISATGFVLRRLDAVIAVNEEIARLFVRLGLQPSRIHVICPYSAVSLRDDVAVPEDVGVFCRTHSPLLTTVGLLEPEYDLSLQIRTLPLVRQQFPRAGLVIVGSGSLEADLRRLIAESPVGDDVLLSGDLPHPVTVRLIAESDMFLRTTKYDGDSVSVREALQLGTPVIASDNRMRPEGVHLISRSDPETLCQAIATVAALPAADARRDHSGEQDLDRVLELYARLGRTEAAAAKPSTAPS